ncbi:hypothetical protein BDV35DRAFT_384400 [Aspergillus flavus]|uniref:Uncharacterized protein n=1 Tax=Aspergillus flavus TaxID=5059 RepID=A0A5N6GNH5_ASPFL|nr:hypothetical protein BDV35DRAFT_384400 [Aspergillus flavus]
MGLLHRCSEGRFQWGLAGSKAKPLIHVHKDSEQLTDANTVYESSESNCIPSNGMEENKAGIKEEVKKEESLKRSKTQLQVETSSHENSQMAHPTLSETGKRSMRKRGYQKQEQSQEGQGLEKERKQKGKK